MTTLSARQQVVRDVLQEASVGDLDRVAVDIITALYLQGFLSPQHDQDRQGFPREQPT